VSVGDGKGNLINITSPNGGEIWHEGTNQTITWETSGDIGGNEVYVGYSTDAGITWYDIDGDGKTSSPPSPLYSSSWDIYPNNGQIAWVTPGLSDTSIHALIGIWSSAEPSAHYDVIDAYFTITADSNYHRILHPNGGETFTMGSERSIYWESGGNCAGVGHIRLYYSIYGGDSWYLIDNHVTNDGSYVWSVPTLQSDNSNCMIKIEDAVYPESFDVSDATFTIAETGGGLEIDMDFESGEDTSGWTFGGNWTINSDDAYSGTRSANCSSYPYIPQTMFTIATVNSGIVQFFYKAAFKDDNYLTHNSLKFKVDDVTFLDTAQDQNAWTLVEVYVESGTHTFEWIFEITHSSHLSNYARVDAISFP
jgi:hypothetical protein